MKKKAHIYLDVASAHSRKGKSGEEGWLRHGECGGAKEIEVIRCPLTYSTPTFTGVGHQ